MLLNNNILIMVTIIIIRGATHPGSQDHKCYPFKPWQPHSLAPLPGVGSSAGHAGVCQCRLSPLRRPQTPPKKRSAAAAAACLAHPLQHLHTAATEWWWCLAIPSPSLSGVQVIGLTAAPKYRSPLLPWLPAPF